MINTAVESELMNFIWFIDGRHKISDKVLAKVEALVTKGPSNLTVLYDKREKSQERSFWLSDNKIKELDKLKELEDRLHIENKVLLDKNFEQMGITYKFDVIDKQVNYDAIIKQHNVNSASTLLLQNEAPEVRHPIFQLLSTLPANILLLTKSKWHKEVKLLACIDPLHEHTRPDSLDHSIVRQAQLLSARLTASWKVAHTVFTPPAFIVYRKQFEEIHYQGLLDFTESLGLKKEQSVLLKGLPEHALPTWLHNNGGDILTLGIIARNKLVSRLIGSTTVALLQAPPADLYLIHESN